MHSLTLSTSQIIIIVLNNFQLYWDYMSQLCSKLSKISQTIFLREEKSVSLKSFKSHSGDDVKSAL